MSYLNGFSDGISSRGQVRTDGTDTFVPVGAAPAVAPEFVFRRDLLESAYQNWVSANRARYLSTLNSDATPFGHAQLVRYQTSSGEVDLRFHLDTAGKAYDIGLALPDTPGFMQADIQTIIERFLWALTLSDSNIQRTFFNASNIRVDFGVLGGLDEQLGAYRRALASGDSPEGLVLEQHEQVSTIRIPVQNQELSIAFEPSLTLLLNDQADVVSDYLYEFLTAGNQGFWQQHAGPADLHQPEITDSELRYTTLNQQMDENRVVRTFADFIPAAASPDSEEALRESRFLHWSSWPYWKHIPGYVDGLKPANVRLVLEGVDLHELPEVDAAKIADLAAFLSEGMVVLTDTESPRRNRDGAIALTSYVVFHNPGLSYQHMVRIRETFTLQDHGYEQDSAEVHVLLTVRLDNVRNLYARHFGTSASDPIRIHIRQ